MLFQLQPCGFKGDRNYLQGPDILNATLSKLSELHETISNIDISFHKMSSFQLVALTHEDLKVSDPVAICRYQSNGEARAVYLVETDEAVVNRYPYPEDEIVSNFQFDIKNKKCSLVNSLPYSNIEIWVAMTKALHQRIFSDKLGKWLFVRGRFPEYLLKPHISECIVSLSAGVGGKLTRSRVQQDGVACGEIFFSIA